MANAMVSTGSDALSGRNGGTGMGRHRLPDRRGVRRDKRWDSYEHSLERYADSDVAPDWFDPAAIGERWEDD